MSKTVVLLRHDGTQFDVEVTTQDQVSSYKLLEKDTEIESTTLSTSTDSELIVIDSVNSGTGGRRCGGPTDFYTVVMKPVLERVRGPYRYVRTESRDTIKHFAENFVTEPGKKYDILFLSGDTSVSEFINNLSPLYLLQTSKSISILPIPMGTGNALASSLGFKCPVVAFQKYICNELSAKPLPIYELVLPDQSSFYFFVILSMGFHANLLHCAEDPKYKNMGVERFRVASQTVAQEYDLAVDISLNNDSYHRFAYFALVNTSHLEPSYIPSPKSVVHRCELHVLGYDASLTQEALFSKIMKGYKNDLETDISETGTLYEPIRENFVLKVKNEVGAPVYRYDMCCDGELFNLRNFPSDDSMYELNINFVHENCLQIYL